MTPEMMMGNGGQQPPPPEEATSAGDVAGTLRAIIAQIGQVAQMVPEAQQELMVAAKALTQASLKVVASQPEPPQGQPILGA